MMNFTEKIAIASYLETTEIEERVLKELMISTKTCQSEEIQFWF